MPRAEAGEDAHPEPFFVRRPPGAGVPARSRGLAGEGEERRGAGAASGSGSDTGQAMNELRQVEVTVNGTVYRERAEPRLTLADFLRHTLGLTGTHVGCEHGVCGCCTVRLDGAAVRSCILFAVQANGRRIETVEGLAEGERLHPLQEAFSDHGALQCGFCTPGFLMTAIEFLERNPSPDEEAVRDALSGNLCRCTGYQSIVAAVLDAAGRLRQGDDRGAEAGAGTGPRPRP